VTSCGFITWTMVKVTLKRFARTDPADPPPMITMSNTISLTFYAFGELQPFNN